MARQWFKKGEGGVKMRRIVEVYEAHSAEEANQKLKQGWRLHSVFGTHKKRLYILTLMAEVEELV